MYSVVVKEKKWVLGLGVIVTLFFGMLLVLGVRQGIQENNTGEIILCGIIGGIFVLMGLCLLLDALLRRLALGYQECHYRTMFGQIKYFTLRDIAKIETKGEYIYLLDAFGEKIVRFESNMDHAAETLAFIQNSGGMDAYGQPKIVIQARRLSPKARKNQEKREREEKKQREKWLEAESTWEHSYFYENPKWIKRLRVLAWGLNLGGFAVCYLCIKLPLTASARLAVFYPLAVWVFWLCFHRVMVWKKNPWLPKGAENYITVPCLGMLFLFPVASHGYIYGAENGKIWIFSLLLFGVLLAAILVITHTKRGYMELLAPLVLLVIYIFFNVFNWPVALHTRDTRHEMVRVVEMDVEEHSEGGYSYYFTVESLEGDTWTMEVMPALYRNTEEGDPVFICINSSLLGDYCYLHGLEDDCGE